MSEWHCGADLLAQYAVGHGDVALSASVEAHLIGCASCRTALADHVDPAAFGPVWTGIRAAIQPQTLTARALRRLGVRTEDAVLLDASRSLRGPWVLATVAVLVFATVASFPNAVLGRALYLLAAPLLPVLGVVGAFSLTDPMAELTNATPYSKIRIALLRTLAVTVTTVPFVAIMGAAALGVGWLSVAWLGPAIGLTLSALVALTWWDPNTVGATLALGWAAVVAVAYQQHHLSSTVRVDAQICYLAIAFITGVTLAIRIRTAHAPGGYA